jgi:hypothetical protein
MRKLAQRQFVSINEEGFQHPQSTFHAVHVPSTRKVDSFGTRTSPQRTNSVPSPNSPARNGGNDIISIVCVHITNSLFILIFIYMVYLKFVIYASIDIMLNLGFIYFLTLHGYLPLELTFIDILCCTDVDFFKNQSSQESPEVVFLKEIRGSEIDNSHDSYDDVYIGNHRLSPVRRHTSEAIDAMYDNNNLSNQKSQASSSSILPPRRIVMPSRYVSSPYDENISSYEQDQDQKKHYQAIIRLANMDGYKQ